MATGTDSVPATTSYDQCNAVQRFNRRFAASGPGSWLFARLLHHIDRPVHRMTRGRHTLGSLVSGLPVVMLTTTGARSGVKRTVPVLGLPTPDGLAVIASNYGQERHPGWYHNLLAEPRVSARIGSTERPFRAEVVKDPAERDRLYAIAASAMSGYGGYEKKTDRTIPVVRLHGVTQ